MLVGIMLGCGARAAQVAYAQGAPSDPGLAPGQSVTRWQNACEVLELDDEDDEDHAKLRKRGEQGWELAGVAILSPAHSSLVCFKRPAR